MIDYKKLIDDLNKDYLTRINGNKDKIIEAFVIYYGEEYRKLITNKYNETFFCWYISDFISHIYNDYICKNILEDRIKYTKEILKRLGYNVDEIECKAKKGTIDKKGEKVIINSGSIQSVIDKNGNQLDNILKNLFGKNRVFDFKYSENNLYNFFSLNKKKQEKFIKKVFKNQEKNESIEKIKNAIEYMNSIKEKQDYEKKYIDFYLFDMYINNRKEKQNKNSTLLRKISKDSSSSIKYNNHINRVIGSTNNYIFSQDYKNILSSIERHIDKNPFEKTISQNQRVIVFPILYMNDCNIIHEINHSITSSALVIKEDNNIRTLITKTGIDITGKKYRLLEELINDRSSIDITEIFHSLGGTIFDKDEYNIPIINLYEKISPSIESFYQKYKEPLKKCRITENKSLIFKYIDQDIFIEFNNHIKNIVKKIDSKGKASNIKFITEEQIEYANKLVDKMDKKQSVQEISFEELIDELKIKGKKVRILNYFNQQNDNEEKEEISHKKR